MFRAPSMHKTRRYDLKLLTHFCVRGIARSGVRGRGASQGRDEEAGDVCDRERVATRVAGNAVSQNWQRSLIPSWPTPHRNSGLMQLNLPIVLKETGNLKLHINYLKIKIYLCTGWCSRGTSWAHSLNPTRWRQGTAWSLRTRNQDQQVGTKWRKWACLCTNAKHQGQPRKKRLHSWPSGQWTQEGKRCWGNCSSSILDARTQLPRTRSGV